MADPKAAARGHATPPPAATVTHSRRGPARTASPIRAMSHDRHPAVRWMLLMASVFAAPSVSRPTRHLPAWRAPASAEHGAPSGRSAPAKPSTWIARGGHDRSEPHTGEPVTDRCECFGRRTRRARMHSALFTNPSDRAAAIVRPDAGGPPASGPESWTSTLRSACAEAG